MTEKTKVVLKFKVSSFRKIPNPFYNSTDENQDFVNQLNQPEMYLIICDVKDIPENIPMGTNPREQKLTTRVAQKIEESLTDPTLRNFYLLNRGLLLSAEHVSYDNGSNLVTITFGDLSVHGNVDGGHTYKIICENRVLLDAGQQFVKIEVVTGVEDMFEQLAAARNTSIQVKDTSIAELEKRFNLIKEAFEKEKFASRIAYKENDNLNDKDIDISDLLAIFNLFNIDKYKGTSSYPITSYSSKATCVQTYITEDKDHQSDPENNPFVKMKPIMVDIVRLYDEIELRMPTFYKGDENGVKKYGAITGVTVHKSGKPKFTTKFYLYEQEYYSPTGFLYPILGAFRALVKESNGVYTWKLNPFKILDKIGVSLVNSTINSSRELGNNPNKAGKSNNLWMTLFMMVQMEVMQTME